ncbi:MAG: hypothetical protein V3V08_08220 [Nannocystaceae bacterium]
MSHSTTDSTRETTGSAIRRFVQLLAFTFACALGSSALPSIAAAGEIKFGQGHDSLSTDDSGNLSGAGRKAAVKEIDRTPGEDLWHVDVWGKIDHGQPGTIYFEFYASIDGNENIVQRYTDDAYEGGRYLSMSVELDGNEGFNKDRTYVVYAVQVNEKGKDVRLAKGKVKLIDTGRKPEPTKEAGDPGEGDDEGDDQDDDQDDLDGLGDAQPVEPPPVAPKEKKGCAVADTPSPAGKLGACLVAVVWFVSRRRRTA